MSDGESQPELLSWDGFGGDVAYWERHFAAAPQGLATDPAAAQYEWVSQDLEGLAALLAPHLPPSGRVLHLGCGMSVLPGLLLEAAGGGALEVLSLDASETCVREMRRRFAAEPKLAWALADVADAGALEGALGEGAGVCAAVEKGCLDALLCVSEEGAAQYVAAVAKLLPAGAPFLLVSNCPVRHRHLNRYFDVQEVLPLGQDSGAFGASLYVALRRPAAEAEEGEEEGGEVLFQDQR